MIKVSVLYPNTAGSRFDFEYYMAKHVPMVGSLLAEGMRKAEVDRGASGAAPGEPAPFHAIAHLHFDSAEAFGTAFAPHANQIMGDIPNYTDVSPQIQISEVVL